MNKPPKKTKSAKPRPKNYATKLKINASFGDAVKAIVSHNPKK